MLWGLRRAPSRETEAMAFLFKHKNRSPSEQVIQVGDDLVELGIPRRNGKGPSNPKSGSTRDQQLARAGKHIDQLRKMLIGEERQDNDGKYNDLLYDSILEGAAGATTQLSDAAIVEMCRNDLIHQLCLALSVLGMDACKDIAICFNITVHRTIDASRPGLEYLLQNLHIFEILSAGYKSDSTALHCGSMIRECARHIQLARIMVTEPGTVLTDFFTHVESPMFEVASDAFDTFRDLLLLHKDLTSKLLRERYEDFFQSYTKLLLSENFVTKRQSLKLLGVLILEQRGDGMVPYINDARALMVVMNLLRDSSKTIQFEAFHIFKVFALNPNKPQAIVEILVRNRDKLLSFLSAFQPDKDADAKFKGEKSIVLQHIKDMGNT